MKLTIDNITDNPNIKKLLRSYNPADTAVGITMLNRDPFTDFDFKLFLFTEVGSGGVELLYECSYLQPIDYATTSTEERCNLWLIKEK